MAEPRRRRPKGTGSIYKRASDDRWYVSFEVKVGRGETRRRRSLSSALFCEVLQRYSDEVPLLPPRPEVVSPRESLARAREKGTHTAREWNALIRKSESKCAYCGRKCGAFTLTMDHRVPLSRGGSDGIENLAVACRWCNFHKSSLTDVEFVEYLDRSGLGAQLAKEPLDVDWRWTRRKGRK